MDVEGLQKFCKTLPHVTEDVKWESHLCFLIGNKMFVITDLDAGSRRATLKSSPEEFFELVERDGIVPSMYLARSHWITIEDIRKVRDAELKELVRRSYDLIKAKLPKKLQAKLSA